MRWAPALLVLLLLVPAAAGQRLGRSNPEDGPVTLHFHMEGFQDFPINTQPAEFLDWEEASFGVAPQTVTCLPETPVAGLGEGYHTSYGYSSPSYVEYDATEDGRPRTWPERQLGYEAVLDVGMAPVLHWYVETVVPSPTDVPSPPQVVPNVVVEATLRIGDSISVDDKAYNTGPVIAAGRSAPALLAADQSRGVEHSMVGGRHVYHFTVPMDLEAPSIGDKGYNLRVDIYFDNPACRGQEGALMTNNVRPFSDADHRPRIETGVLRPLRIDSLVPSFNGSRVVINASMQSVWGNYDIDEGNLTLSIDGPGGHLELPPAAVVQMYDAHNHHADPVLVTWEWDRSDMPDGHYWLGFTATNDQRTANATATAAVELGPDRAFAAVEELPGEPEQAVPQGPAGALLLALAALALARRAR